MSDLNTDTWGEKLCDLPEEAEKGDQVRIEYRSNRSSSRDTMSVKEKTGEVTREKHIGWDRKNPHMRIDTGEKYDNGAPKLLELVGTTVDSVGKKQQTRLGPLVDFEITEKSDE